MPHLPENEKGGPRQQPSMGSAVAFNISQKLQNDAEEGICQSLKKNCFTSIQKLRRKEIIHSSLNDTALIASLQIFPSVYPLLVI